MKCRVQHELIRNAVFDTRKFFMAHIENQLLCNDPESSPKLYLRYIDDIFAIFDNDQSCTKFLEKLNTQHPNIKLL